MLNHVSTPAPASSDVGGSTPSSHVQQEEQEEPQVDVSQAMLDDPIVGSKHVALDEHGPGGLGPKPLASTRRWQT